MQGKARRDNTTQYDTIRNNLGQDKATQDKTIQYVLRNTQYNTIRSKNKQSYTTQCEIRQDMITPGKTSWYNTNYEHIRRYKTIEYKTTQDNTILDETR